MNKFIENVLIAAMIVMGVCLFSFGLGTLISPYVTKPPNYDDRLGIAYGCGMLAENRRLLKLQELNSQPELARCAEFRKRWEDLH